MTEEAVVKAGAFVKGFAFSYTLIQAPCLSDKLSNGQPQAGRCKARLASFPWGSQHGRHHQEQQQQGPEALVALGRTCVSGYAIKQ